MNQSRPSRPRPSRPAAPKSSAGTPAPAADRRRQAKSPAHPAPWRSGEKATSHKQEDSGDWRPGQGHAPAARSHPRPPRESVPLHPPKPRPPAAGTPPASKSEVPRRNANVSSRTPARKAAPAPERAPQRREPTVSAPTQGGAVHWRDQFRTLLSDAGYQPLDESALGRKLKVPPQESDAFTEFVAEQERVGGAMRDDRGRLVAPKRLGYSAGHLQMNERGFGFLVSSDPAEPDFYIAGEDTANALHGDLVLARLKPNRGQRDSRLRGEVVRLLHRKRRQLVGVLARNPQFYYVRPDETRIPFDVRVLGKLDDAPVGQKVVVELEEWRDPNQPLQGRITEVLGTPDAPGVDLLSIIRKHDLPTSFPEAVEQQAASIPALIGLDEIARREDFRGLFTFTIDPDDAKDFDDALSYRLLDGGAMEVFIHIADVSHYVEPGTPLDVEARARGNSVYLVDRVIPMLPEKLSNGLCSLQPKVDRLVKTAVVTLDAKGEIRDFRFAEGVIHSRTRLSYQQAFARLQERPSSDLDHDLHTLNGMARTLRQRRFSRGALDLEMSEIKVRLDANGVPVRLEKMENDLSHQLIEEFMLLANEVVALEIKRRGRPGLYRIHENPDPTRLQEFRAQARAMGFSCGDLTKKGEIQKLLDQSRGKPGEDAVKIGLLKSLKRAVYSPKPLGHFGLSKINYTHFTSPIRRYSDLIVHRILFQRDRAAFSYDELARLALHLSTTERTASEAEQESVKLKKLEYFEQQSRADNRAAFSALVLEVREKGLLVQVPEFQVQGLVPAASGDFIFNAQRLELQDRRSKKTYHAGQTLMVEVAAVDLARNQIDFRLAGMPPARADKPAGRGR